MNERREMEPPESAVSFVARLAHAGRFSQTTPGRVVLGDFDQER